MKKILGRSIGALAALLLASGSAHAAVIITVVENGGDVVFSTVDGSTLDLTGLTALGSSLNADPVINPFSGLFGIGAACSLCYEQYTGVVSFAGAFGSGGPQAPTFSSGTLFGFSLSRLRINSSYVSGTPLSASSTFEGETLATLGISGPADYVWTLPNDTVTLQVIPVPAAAWLFGSALGLLGWMRRKTA